MDRDIFLSENSKSSPLLIMQINSKDGTQSNIYVGEQDNPDELAVLFCKIHELPEQIIERVANQIAHKRTIALEAQNKKMQEEQSPRPDSSVDGSRSYANQNVFNRMHSYADLHKHKREALAANIEQERRNGVEATTFR